MQKTLLTATVVAAMITPAALAVAGDRTVTVPTPKSITIVCSDSVKPGTVVLTNPPKFSCQDYDLAKAMVGTGITVGPDVNVNRITRALRRATSTTTVAGRIEKRRNEINNRLVNRSKSEIVNGWRDVRMPELESRKPSVHMDNSWRAIPDTSLDDFDKNFPGINRNRKFFVSDSDVCKGWVSVVKILNGECKNSKVRVN
tara:strand:- start:167 stop:766 length:600 start_codon:yes stop_codon:yes gene_type:complete